MCFSSHFWNKPKQQHGWEAVVILRNFRKTKLSKSKFLFFSFFFFFSSISTCIQCATRRLSLCDIRKYRFPAFYGTSDRQAAIFFCSRMIQTWSSFSLVDPCSIFFCFSVKPKFFTPTHATVKPFCVKQHSCLQLWVPWKPPVNFCWVFVV